MRIEMAENLILWVFQPFFMLLKTNKIGQCTFFPNDEVIGQVKTA